MAVKVGEMFQRFTLGGSHQAKEIPVDVFSGLVFFCALAGGSRGLLARWFDVNNGLVEKFGKTNARSQQIG